MTITTKPSILHLGNLNPHVIHTIEQQSSLALPRQTAPAQLASPAAAWGVSAFAFQGTNAHAVLVSGGAQPALRSEAMAAWAKSRFWIGPEAHPLAGKLARASAAAAMFETDLLQPQHGRLWEHVVLGRPLLPGAAFLEAAAAGLYLASNSPAALLSSVSIPAPLELPSNAMRSLCLQCQITLATGAVRLTSSSSSGSRNHMFGEAASGANHSTATKAAAMPREVLATALLPTSHTSAPAAAIGSISAVRADGRLGGRGIDPACLDAAFHLGAIPITGPAVLRVPASIAAYSSAAPGGGRDALDGGCQCVSDANNAATNNYWLAGACFVGGMVAKSMSKLALATQNVAASPAPGHLSGQLLYIIVWQAAVSLAAGPLDNPAAAATLTAKHPGQDLCLSAVAALQQAGGAASLQTMGLHEVTFQPAPGASSSSAALFGMLKSLALESGAVGMAAADLDPAAAASADPMLEFSLHGTEDSYGVARRGGCRFQPALQLQVPQPQTGSQAQQSAFVITGGTGTLGRLVAHSLINSQTSGDYCLLGRAGRFDDPAAMELLASSLAGTSATLAISMCDTAASEDARQALESVCSGRPLALIHSGGVLADALLVNITASQVRRVFAPKLAGLQSLRSSLSLKPAARQLLFSSVAALLGSPGQANYSGANALLDSIAQSSQAQVRLLLQISHVGCLISKLLTSDANGMQGIDCTSIQWGAWAGAGMASQDRSTALRVGRLGMGMVDPAQGLAAVQALLGSGMVASVTSAVPFDWAKLAAQPRPASIFLDIIQPSAPAAPGYQAQSVALSRTLVQSSVLTMLHGILGEDIGPHEPLMAAGLDSLASVEFTNMLEAEFKIKLPSTLIFDYPSAASISDYIVTRLSAAAPASALPPAASAAEQAAHNESIERLVISLAVGITGDTDLGTDQPLMAAGLDSLGAVELRNSLESSFAIEMPSTLVFDYPTVKSMAGYIASRLGPVISSVTVTDSMTSGALSSRSALMEGAAMTSLATRSPKVNRWPGDALVPMPAVL